jgi:hypothetical protein
MHDASHELPTVVLLRTGDDVLHLHNWRTRDDFAARCIDPDEPATEHDGIA